MTHDSGSTFKSGTGHILFKNPYLKVLLVLLVCQFVCMRLVVTKTILPPASQNHHDQQSLRYEAGGNALREQK